MNGTMMKTANGIRRNKSCVVRRSYTRATGVIIQIQIYSGRCATYLPSLSAREGLALENLPLEACRNADLFGEEFRAMPIVLGLVLNLLPRTRDDRFR